MPSSPFYPSVSNLVSASNFPAQLQVIQDGLQKILSKIYYKEFQCVKNADGSQVYYNITLVTGQVLKIDLFGSGFALIFNPNHDSSQETILDLSLSYNWPILGIINSFRMEGFAYLASEMKNILDKIISLGGFDSLVACISTFESDANDMVSSINSFVDKVNTQYGSNTIPYPAIGDESAMIEEVLSSIENSSVSAINNVKDVINNIYLNDALPNFLENLKQFAHSITGEDIVERIKKLITPQIDASINHISVGLAFPRNVLMPLDKPVEEGGEPLKNEQEQEQEQAMLIFEAGDLFFSTQGGVGFNKELKAELNHPVQIGNTGLGLTIEDAKLDLSTTTNIVEADLDGRPVDFMGVYVAKVAITLPSKWFKQEDNSTLQISGNNMLIGTGGLSGRIALEAKNGGSIPNGSSLSAKLGDNFKIGFTSFDITFKQNQVISSNIKAWLLIPNFKKGESGSEELKIDILGHFAANGDFNLTAAMLPNGLPANLFNFVNFNFHTFELGRENNVFYLGTSCDVGFNNDVMKKIIGDQKISLPKVRIYSNGKFELVGGNTFIPANISLHLGPVDVSVTGICFGSHEQKDKNGTVRQYNYFGFDGAISIDPIGIDVKGEGLKYYYTVDGGTKDHFIHIKTLKVDLIIPGNATPANAMIMINGMLSIPEPGETPEYRGKISLSMPKLKLAAGVDMKIMPKEPAFIVDAFVDLPAPIPIGPVGIYGFRGLFGYRYIAEKESVGLVSGVNTWYEYYKYPPRGIDISKFSLPNKTKNYKVAFSLGVGAVLGTSFDSGTIISARVMLVLSLPSCFMIDGKASLISARLGLDDSKEPPFFAMVAFGDNSIEFGLGADFKLKQEDGKLVTVYANAEGYFPTKGGGSWYVNLGTKDKPIQAVLFKDVLDLKASTYLMLSAKGLETGASVSFDLRKSFFGIKVHLYAWVEVGGFISFERPQLGGYLYFGGGIEVNVWKLIYLAFDLSVYLSAEFPKPLKFYARLMFSGEIKILFIKISFKVKLELSWEKTKAVDTTPISPLPNVRKKELVKAVHMLTNESYDLKVLNTPPININDINNTKPIPVDSYIDIKSAKGLVNKISYDVIGSGTMANPTNHQDKIPSIETSKGGDVRRVIHEYSIEKFGLYAWNGNEWVDYHPFEALTEAGTERDNVSNLPIGSWQYANNQYDTVRLLATNPFSFIDAGEPGWFVPEYQGITGKKMFCQEEIKENVLNFLNKYINILENQYSIVYNYNYSNYYEINGAYFNLAEENTDLTTPIWQNNSIKLNTFVIQYTLDNPHGFNKSLCFLNYNRLAIMLPEHSVVVKLLLTSCAPSVKIKYYRGYFPNNSSQIQYQLVEEKILTYLELANQIVYDDPDNPIIKIIIEPQQPNDKIIADINERIQKLIARAHGYSTGQLIFDPKDEREYNSLLSELRLYADDGHSHSGYGNTSFYKATCLQEMRWLSFETYKYLQIIPTAGDRQGDQLNMRQAVNTFIQPVWRPLTNYYIHFKLRDSVKYNNKTTKYDYNYYYGFRTTGNIGHVDIPAKKKDVITHEITSYNLGDELNRLERYIDFKRSYPNADGSLLQSKPLFWGHYECKINIFFTKAYTYHLLNKWPQYGGLNELNSCLNIKIKDPVSEELIPYPLPSEHTLDIPVAEGNNETNGSIWKVDKNPVMPTSVQLMNNLLENNEDIPCDLFIAALEPAANYYSVKLTNLKPSKLYTALIYNDFNQDINSLPEEYNAEIHRFVFQTSRFATFEEQVKSHILKDDEGNERQAVFELSTDISTESEDKVYEIVWEPNNDTLPELSFKYSHNFDKLIEGVFRFKPLEVAVTTEFNIIRNKTEDIIAILIRNPEPFNDPKIPLDEIKDTIVVFDDQSEEPDTGFKTLYSKDYSQAIITKQGEYITENHLNIRFRYKLWNGDNYKVENESKVLIKC